jgi:hypothetical protein
MPPFLHSFAKQIFCFLQVGIKPRQAAEDDNDNDSRSSSPPHLAPSRIHSNKRTNGSSNGSNSSDESDRSNDATEVEIPFPQRKGTHLFYNSMAAFCNNLYHIIIN